MFPPRVSPALSLLAGAYDPCFTWDAEILGAIGGGADSLAVRLPAACGRGESGYRQTTNFSHPSQISDQAWASMFARRFFLQAASAPYKIPSTAMMTGGLQP